MTKTLNSIYKVFVISALILLAFGVSLQTPAELVRGLMAIFTAPAVLVTDFVYIGGLGPAIVNGVILAMASVGILVLLKTEQGSGTIANLWLLVGFGLFGKTIINVLPIYLGGYLYARFRKESYSNSILTILVASSMAPAVSQKLFIGIGNTALSILAAFAMGVAIGFVFEPLAKNVFKAHDGFNLYNGGLTAGILAIFITSTLSTFGIEPGLNDIWSEGNNVMISIITIVLCVFFIFIGWYCNRDLGIMGILKKLKGISGTKSNYYPEFGTLCYINMGLLGLFCILAAVIFDMQLSGLAWGGIITIIGFGANGKNVPSAIALMIGIGIATFFSPFHIRDPGVVVAFYFVTALSPIPNMFGLHWGVIAGIIHLHVVTSLAGPSGGINLYNNGLAAGLIAMLLVPFILALKNRKKLLKKMRDTQQKNE
ncbi:MAG: DUF1576 domain-containing protein [Lachnospiraceae bacterium]|nr:DUF1576 domain-containing protein [Lachnospiraceae bacterium]